MEQVSRVGCVLEVLIDAAASIIWSSVSYFNVAHNSNRWPSECVFCGDSDSREEQRREGGGQEVEKQDHMRDEREIKLVWTGTGYKKD